MAEWSVLTARIITFSSPRLVQFLLPGRKQNLLVCLRKEAAMAAGQILTTGKELPGKNSSYGSCLFFPLKKFSKVLSGRHRLMELEILVESFRERN